MSALSAEATAWLPNLGVALAIAFMYGAAKSSPAPTPFTAPDTATGAAYMTAAVSPKTCNLSVSLAKAASLPCKFFNLSSSLSLSNNMSANVSTSSVATAASTAAIVPNC